MQLAEQILPDNHYQKYIRLFCGVLFLILLIIFRRQGLIGNSEIILDSWFSKDTYLAPFRKSEYQKLGAAVKNLFHRKKV